LIYNWLYRCGGKY